MTAKRSNVPAASYIGSMWGVFFASLTALSFGICVSAVELALRRVEVVNFPLPKTNPLKIFFVRGNEDPMADWQEKFSRVTAVRHRSSIFLFEGDLNAFFKRSISSGSPDSKVSVNLRITEKYFQMGTITYPPFLKYPLCIQTRGGFKNNGEGFVYRPHRTYICSLPLPDFVAAPLVNAVLAKTFSSKSAAPFVASWQSLKDVSLLSGRLVLTWE